MRILVTGSEGFIGSRLCARLEGEGHEVEHCDRKLGYDSDASCPPSGRFDIVYHLAANSDISRGAEDPWADYEATVASTFWMLRSIDTPRIVYLSGSGVYGDTGGDPVTEWSPIRPISAYGAAKASAEAWLSYWAAGDPERTVTVLRPCNIVGPGMTHGAVFDFVRALQRDPTRLTVKGDGYQLKPYLHVDDLIDAMLVPAARGFSVTNVPGAGMLNVRGIAGIVADVMGVAPKVSYGKSMRGWPGDVPCVRIAGGERLRLAGWEPQWAADLSVIEAVRWLQEHR